MKKVVDYEARRSTLFELTKFIARRDLQEPGSQSYEDWTRVLDDVYEYEELVMEDLCKRA